jgi:hypothetical protein
VQAVDQLFGRRCGVGEDAEPCERILALVETQVRRRYRRPADAVKAVAAREEVAGNLVRGAVDSAGDARRRAGEIVHRDVAHLEEQRPA